MSERRESSLKARLADFHDQIKKIKASGNETSQSLINVTDVNELTLEEKVVWDTYLAFLKRAYFGNGDHKQLVAEIFDFDKQIRVIRKDRTVSDNRDSFLDWVTNRLTVITTSVNVRDTNQAEIQRLLKEDYDAFVK